MFQHRELSNCFPRSELVNGSLMKSEANNVKVHFKLKIMAGAMQ